MPAPALAVTMIHLCQEILLEHGHYRTYPAAYPISGI
jgi:hypothetical protein